MRLSDWVRTQIEALRSIIVPDEPPPVPPDGVIQTPEGDGVMMRFLSSTVNLSRVRKAIEQFCETTQLDQPARDEIGLVVNEALANVIRHAYSNAQDKPIELHVLRDLRGVCGFGFVTGVAVKILRTIMKSRTTRWCPVVWGLSA